jgi:HAMP domain-containing protein
VLGRLNDLDLRRKIVVAAVLPAVALAAVFLGIVSIQRARLAGKVEQAVGQLAEENLARAARDLRTLCAATHQELSRQVPRSLAVARDELARAGALSFARETVGWRAVNQLDRSSVEVTLPRLLLGGAWVAPNDEFGRRAPVVDRVRELAGAEATLFQRMNDRGDMLRVATTVPDAQGRRAIGTYIPAIEPDGRPNPVVAAVVRGETYVGRARVVDHWYLAGYEPLRDRDGRIVGMLFIGLRQDSLEGLRAGVAASRIGRTGAMYVLGASGNQRGQYLIPPPGHADGEDAWEQRDARGELHVQRLVEAALAVPAGGTALVASAGPAGIPAARDRLAAVSYFAPWDWVIVAETDRDEARAALREIETSLSSTVGAAITAALALLAVTAWIAYRAAGRVAGPLEAMATAAERIAEGDVQQDVTWRSHDEVGRLAEAFRHTIGYLQEVARGASAVAAGDLSRPVALRSDRDVLGKSFQAAQAELRRLAEETGRLTRAAVEGRLDARADVTAFRGEFRAIVEGVNATLETLVSHLDAVPVPAMIIGRDFEIRYMNASGASLLGRSQRELVGTRCHDAFRTGDCRTARCACARAMADDREVTSETDAHPEGLDLDIVYSAVPLHDADGRIIGGLEIVVDQTAVPPRTGERSRGT